MSRKLASIFASIAIAAAVIAPATAQPRNHDVSVTVSYADLDLSKPAGAKVLSKRLEQALKKVCGNPRTTKSIAIVQKVKSCLDQSRAVAVASIDAPLLTALYEGSEGARFAGL